MGQSVSKRPRPVKRNTLPPDAVSLEAMIRRVQNDMRKRAEHAKQSPHDRKVLRALRELHGQRAVALLNLHALDSARFTALTRELNIVFERES